MLTQILSPSMYSQ